jgi:hypothetical protein
LDKKFATYLLAKLNAKYGEDADYRCYEGSSGSTSQWTMNIYSQKQGAIIGYSNHIFFCINHSQLPSRRAVGNWSGYTPLENKTDWEAVLKDCYDYTATIEQYKKEIAILPKLAVYWDDILSLVTKMKYIVPEGSNGHNGSYDLQHIFPLLGEYPFKE